MYTANSSLATAVLSVGQANTRREQSVFGVYIMYVRMGASRARGFQKIRFTFTNISANALYKGISAYPQPEFAFTLLSHRFHTAFTSSGWGVGEGSVKAM